MEKKEDFSQREKPQRQWLKKIWGSLPAVFLVLLLMVIGVLFGRIKTQGEILKADKAASLRQDKPAANVVTMALAPTTIRDKISLPGVVKPWVELRVLSEVRGKVVEKALEEGDRVEKGDTIARLDARDYKNAFNSAKASYDAALATLKRLQELFKANVSTQAQLDDAVAKVETYKAAMDNAALDLERCTVRSPMSGIVNRLFIENGQFLNPSDPVAEILQMDRVKVQVGIPESDVDAVRRLSRFKVTIDALGGKAFSGSLHFLSRTADAMARLYNLDIALDNRSGEILPDMFARVEIVKQEVPESISAPLYAVLNRNDENIVYVVEEDTAVSRRVRLGLQEGWRIEIKSGLDVGDSLIVMGQRSVNDGDPVNVVQTVSDPKELVK